MGWKESIQTPTEKQDMKAWLRMVSAYFFWPFMMSCEQGRGWQWAQVGFLSFSQHQPLYQGSFGDRSTWHINTLSKWQWTLPSWGHLDLFTGGAEPFLLGRTATCLRVPWQFQLTTWFFVSFLLLQRYHHHHKRWNIISHPFICCLGLSWISSRGILVGFSLLFSPFYPVVSPIFSLVSVSFF